MLNTSVIQEQVSISILLNMLQYKYNFNQREMFKVIYIYLKNAEVLIWKKE